MKKYHVYGLGNALVDYTFEIDDKFLHDHEVEKGIMTLIDEETHLKLFDELRSRRGHKACGGSAANSVIAVAELGGKTFYSCKVSQDQVGTFYMNDLKSLGVATNLNDEREIGHTGKCFVLVTPDAERSMLSYLGITSSLSYKEVVEDELKKSEYLYLEGYVVSSPAAFKAAQTAIKNAKKWGVKTALSFSDPSMVKFFHEGLETLVKEKLDLLFCNEEEACLYTGLKHWQEAGKKLKELTNLLVLTRGEEGASIFLANDVIQVPSKKVKAIDTNGAGDLFAGAFLYGITHDMTCEMAGTFAAHAASTVVTVQRPRLTKTELATILQEYRG